MGSVGERIRRLRLEKGWGPGRLAAEAHVSRSTVHELEERPSKRPRAATVHLLAMALGVKAAELLGLDEVGGFATEAEARAAFVRCVTAHMAPAESGREAPEAPEDLDLVPGPAPPGGVAGGVEPVRDGPL
jgi:transcriptional regulator with XRE-family HTH domain